MIYYHVLEQLTVYVVVSRFVTGEFARSLKHCTRYGRRQFMLT